MSITVLDSRPAESIPRWLPAPPARTIAAGALVILTSGEDSSYGLYGVFRATREFEPPYSQNDYKEWRFDYTALMALDVLEEVDAVELWTGQ